ncbi:two-component sensor histidine kinase [Algimonas arctica]|uniref:histidine kinase n=1 Tax=Algimonas arctica TaxID=1479486 RepID=A0A8J3CTM3_9PROT|nr:HAMP domain-containing sensor histidine kinase [Algimonas arctica]GHB01157.1 two-component sensor histidine kinase [Algimonas arctica]
MGSSSKSADAQPLGDLAETLGRLLKNTVFRLSLVGALLFGGSLLVAQLIVYDRIVSAEIRRIDDGLRSDLIELQSLFEKGGDRVFQEAKRIGALPIDTPETSPLAQPYFDQGARETVERVVTLRDLSDDTYSMFVFKGRKSGKLVTEEIAALGMDAPSLAGFVSRGLIRERAIATVSDIETDRTEERRVQVLGLVIYEDEVRVGILFVGRDIETIMRTGERMRSAMTTSSFIALFLGILSSIFVARRFARRVDILNKLATDVQAGHLDRRAPRTYSEDEMDRLAEHLNGMLDHIDRLMQAMRYAGDSVAHDLRTPLTRLRTRLETAAVEAGDSPEGDVLYAAAGDADELLSTFDSVLRIARLEAGERRELLKPLDPKPILDDLAELYEPACEDAGLSFTYDIESGLTIMADRGLLSQAVSNLVENAIKYAGGGGGSRIHLSAQKGQRGRVRIFVVDDGPGIPVFDRERVRERFVRLDKSRTLPGSGLGLALVDAIADLHQAELILDDGLGSDAVLAGHDDHDGRPGLKVELVFPRAKSVKTDDSPSDGRKGGSA